MQGTAIHRFPDFRPSASSLPRALHTILCYLDRIEPRTVGTLREIALRPVHITLRFDRLQVGFLFFRPAVECAVLYTPGSPLQLFRLESELTVSLPKQDVKTALATRIQIGARHPGERGEVDGPYAIAIRSYTIPFNADRPHDAALLVLTELPCAVQSSVNGGRVETFSTR